MKRSGLVLLVTVFLSVIFGSPVEARPSELSIDYDLGAACVEDRLDSTRQKDEDRTYEKLGLAVQERNWSRAVTLQKRYVRGWCDNVYRWLDLAKYLHRDGRDSDALTVLTELYEDAPNWFEHQLREDRESILKNILTTETYRQSRLATMRRESLQALKRRRNAFRAELSERSDDLGPPENYVAEGVCPFECCVYRTWSVHGTVTLFESPRSGVSVATVTKGDTVRGLTGKVFLQPEPVGIVKTRRLGRDQRIEDGDILFVLDYLGEGHSHVWWNGDVVAIPTMGIHGHCPQPDDDCWGEYLYPERARKKHDWWVKVRTRDGTVGWTNNVDPFGNLDACG